MVPSDSRKVGMQLEGKTVDGRKVFPWISEVKNQTVVLDFNHPLAGKTLYFDVEVSGTSRKHRRGDSVLLMRGDHRPA